MKHLHNQWLALVLEAQLSDCCVTTKHVSRSRPIAENPKPVYWMAPVLVLKETNRLQWMPDLN